MKAIWNGEVIAESNETVVVEGNHYFPRESVNESLLVPSELHTVCPWKGTASYFHLKVGDTINADAAWVYPETKVPAKKIEGYVAFWRGVNVTE